MHSEKSTARIAGILYLLVALTGAFSIMIVPEMLIRPDNAAETVRNIAANELLFRFGIAAGFLCQIAFIFLVLTLYRLLRNVDRGYAAAMVALVIVAVPIAFLNLLNYLAVLLLMNGSEYWSAFTADQLHALVMLFLGIHHQGVVVVQIFWGLWLFPFGVLVYRSRFLPRALGVFLILACFAYLIKSVTALLLPQFHEAVAPWTAAIAGLGEFAILLWLLIKGASADPRTSPATG
jgi:hypothetical protein